MRRRMFLALPLALTGCTKIYEDHNGVSPLAPTPPPIVANKIEFRVLGRDVSTATPATVRHTDSVNGLTLYSGGLPYLATFGSTDTDVFLYLEAQAFGNLSTSTLQVQVFVDGKLFREGFAQGFTLSAQAAGTYRR